MTRPSLAGLLLAASVLGGCSGIGYYVHLGKGSLALVGRGKSVEALLRDPRTPDRLSARLRFAREVLEFANSNLGLSPGKKYRKYVDLRRDYVVWTVVAAPEFSLEPETWCFPIAGCVGYRGFFSPDKAERFAAELELEGLDVLVGGVQAFSSLGWFADPLLNTFIFDDNRQLAAVLFHELAHGILYVQGDTAFNESFATAVERAAVRRWLLFAAEPSPKAALDEYRQSLEALDRAYAVIAAKRKELEALYVSPTAPFTPAGAEFSGDALGVLSLADKRRRKSDLFAELSRELAALEPQGANAFAGWADRELDNADLASIGFYSAGLAAFEDLLRASNQDLEDFYRAAKCLASLERAERSRRIENREWSECILPDSVR